ncbi:MAG TPA: prepilin peptidase [Patescibacteria group bacterium]|nr:prepilin peptidase [Patescibacteria group bacterium]
MVIFALIVLGLSLGSFVNALVWRLHEQSKSKKEKNNNLSIINGRSICPNCKHQLRKKDLIPVISFISLKGKCRDCKKNISLHYPIVETLLPLLFITSYIWWPNDLNGLQIVNFVLWILILTGLLSLVVYDLKWKILPSKIIYSLIFIAIVQSVFSTISADNHIRYIFNTFLSVLISWGIFYLIYQISQGRWIGGGDVRYGILAGLLVGTPAKVILYIFIASIFGSIISIILITIGKLKKSSTIPFGPFLVTGTYIVVLFGSNIVDWYNRVLLRL